jgi:hypothetical protein
MLVNCTCCRLSAVDKYSFTTDAVPRRQTFSLYFVRYPSCQNILLTEAKTFTRSYLDVVRQWFTGYNRIINYYLASSRLWVTLDQGKPKLNSTNNLNNVFLILYFEQVCPVVSDMKHTNILIHNSPINPASGHTKEPNS